MLDDYINGWNPIGSIVLGGLCFFIVAIAGAFTYNYCQGKRGANAVPGISGFRSQVKGEEFKATQTTSDQRNVSNF
jgi:hypothetical protein